MRHSNAEQFEEQLAESACSLAKSLAPEDIRLGDFVTTLHTIAELPSFLWCADASTLPLHEPVRIQLVSTDAGVPLKVKSVCLPFVLVKHPGGGERILDVRTSRLARLDRKYGNVAWQSLKKRGKRKRK